MCPNSDQNESLEQFPLSPVSESAQGSRHVNPSIWKTLVTTFGLPCIIGVAAIDPGNFEVDLQAGASTGYTLIWALLIASVLGCILQTLSAQVTICTGLHLAELCQRVYSRHWLLSRAVFSIILFSVIAFDIAEVIGTAFAARILFGIPLWIGMIISVCDTMLVLHLQRNGMTRIEMIIEGLLFILAACLFYEFILSKPSFPDIVKGAVIPSFGPNSGEGVVLAISIMGSVIMAHNLFLHSWLEKERRLEQVANDQSIANIFTRNARIPALLRACRYAGFESAAIFFSTFLINTCVLVVAAIVPKESITSARDFGLMQAGALFEFVLGQKFAYTAWGIALLASGHAATVTGVLASQAVCEGFLGIGPGRSSSKVVLASRLIAIIPALIVALVAGEEGSDGLTLSTQATLSFALPFAAIPLFKVLGAIAVEQPAYRRTLLYAGYVVFSVAMVANVYALWSVGRRAFTYGMTVWAAFVLLTATVVVLFICLLLTPIHLTDIATPFDEENDSSEGAYLLPNKNNT